MRENGFIQLNLTNSIFHWKTLRGSINGDVTHTKVRGGGGYQGIFLVEVIWNFTA